MLEHPMVTEIEKTGYPNALAQPECCGIDYFGNELLSGDEIVEFDGEIVLRDNLMEFLSEMGFTFKTIE